MWCVADADLVTNGNNCICTKNSIREGKWRQLKWPVVENQ